jgi:hypothetical protein
MCRRGPHHLCLIGRGWGWSGDWKTVHGRECNDGEPGSGKGRSSGALEELGAGFHGERSGQSIAGAVFEDARVEARVGVHGIPPLADVAAVLGRMSSESISNSLRIRDYIYSNSGFLCIGSQNTALTAY